MADVKTYLALQDRGDPAPYGVIRYGRNTPPERYIPGKGWVDWPAATDWVIGNDTGSKPLSASEAQNLIDSGKLVKLSDAVVEKYRGK